MNIRELRIEMARAGTTNRDLAKELGISDQAFYNKINGSAEFKNSEIKKLASRLSLSMEAVNSIFFDGIVN